MRPERRAGRSSPPRPRSATGSTGSSWRARRTFPSFTSKPPTASSRCCARLATTPGRGPIWQPRKPTRGRGRPGLGAKSWRRARIYLRSFRATWRRPACSKETPTMLANFENALDRLNVASRNGEKAMSLCPAHDDRSNPSLSLRTENGRLLLHCFAGCHPEDIVTEIGLQMKDLFVKGGGECFIPPNTPARLHAQSENPHANGQNERASRDARPEHGCTLKEYSEMKELPENFLRGLGLRDVTYQDKPAVRIPYPDEDGQEVAVRFRVFL